MNVILIISDTLRRDHLGLYGNDWIRTPYLDRFAKSSFVFERAYAASFPTVPNRADVMTGKYTFIYRGWERIRDDEVTLAEVLGEAGYNTMMVADTPHILQRGFHFDRGFSGWEWIRGQENDRLRTSPRDVKLPCSPEKLRSPNVTVKQYLQNVSQRVYEEDYFAPRTMRASAKWLEENRGSDFFLYVDTFDPHEPWDPPRWYSDLYDPDYEGEEVFYPAYGKCEYLTEAELKHAHALYCGEVTLVDRWVGFLLERVEDLGLLDSTAIIFTTDHGFFFGEHGYIGKSIVTEEYFQYVPLYSELSRIPLIVHLPGSRGGRVGAVVQPPDLMPTICELAGVNCPSSVHGRSLVPLLKGERQRRRDFAVSSPPLAETGQISSRRIPSAKSTVSSGKWTFMFGGRYVEGGEAPSTAAVDSFPREYRLLAKEALAPELYDISSDPGELRNLFRERPEIAKGLHKKYIGFLEEIGASEEILRHRRSLEFEV
ncbi:MAG: sulfatase [bacterium]